ncbi:hypothetical protein PV326_014181, partial [Microctonus aethiopoides]
MKFISRFIEIGATKEIYNQRVILLSELFYDKIKISIDQVQLRSYSVDLYENLRKIWERCFNWNPSAVITVPCPDCGSYSYAIRSLTANHKIIHTDGFKALDQCEYFNQPRSQKCMNQFCKNWCSTIIEYANQVFIELDIRPNLNCTGLKCSLDDLPQSIQLKNQSYRLAGVIGYRSGHYIGYVRRRIIHWETYDDMVSSIGRNTSPSIKIDPHGVIYVLSAQKKRCNDAESNITS